MRQRRSPFVEHFPSQLMPRTQTDISRYTGLRTATFPLGPLLGQLEANIDQGLFAAGNVAEVNADLAVVDVAKPTAPLPLHAHRFAAFLGQGRGVENAYRVGLAPCGSPLTYPFGQQRLIVPLGWAAELWPALAFAVVQVSDGLDVLAAQLGQESLDVVRGVGLWRGRLQGVKERWQEGLPSRQEAPEPVGRSVSIIE